MRFLMASKGLVLILALYLALAAAYAAVTPFGQPPDETAHALYVQQLAREHSLPVLRRERREAYEFHQPPLYYLLAAPAWAIGSISRPSSSPDFPPVAIAAARGISILIGALGVWLIAALARAVSPGREWLAMGAAGFAALLPMRLATAGSISNDTLAEAIFTAALLAMVICTRHGADTRRSAALGAILGLGVLTKSSDLLLFPVALIALVLACRSTGERSAAEPGVQDARKRTERGSRYSKPAAAAPAPSELNTALFLRGAAVTFGVALLIGGAWMVRNARLYGDPLGTKAFEQYFQDTPTPAMLQQALNYSWLDLLTRKVVPLTFASFWGVFGHMIHFMGTYPKGAGIPGWAYLLADHGYPPPSSLYPLLLLPTAVAVAGLAYSGVQAFRHSGVQVEGTAPPHRSKARPDGGDAGGTYLNARPGTREAGGARLNAILLLSWFLVLAAYLRFNTAFFQAQGRYLFPAMGPSALGFAAGWLAWWPPRRQGLAVLLLLLGMLVLALHALIGTLMPAYSGSSIAG
jgi:hypothetical protein